MLCDCVCYGVHILCWTLHNCISLLGAHLVDPEQLPLIDRLVVILTAILVVGFGGRVRVVVGVVSIGDDPRIPFLRVPAGGGDRVGAERAVLEGARRRVLVALAVDTRRDGEPVGGVTG